LSPLFQAAKQDVDWRSSGLRQEVHASPKFAELPDNANHFQANGNNSVNYHHEPMNTEQATRNYVHSQNPATASLPRTDLSRQQFSHPQTPPGTTELDGQSWPRSSNGPYPTPTSIQHGNGAQSTSQSKPFNAKSVEDDLKRMLKLSLNGGSLGSPGVH
jgi:hypothetical protein